MSTRLPNAYDETNTKQHKYTKALDVPPPKFCEDLYYQEGGFADNTYLIPHSREFFYDQRKEFTHLRNYFRPIISATIRPVFASGVVRKMDGDATAISLYEAFIEDAYGNKTGLTEVMKHGATIAQVSGCAIFCMDNVPNPAETPEDAFDRRAFPFLSIFRPGDVDSYGMDAFGNMISIVLVMRTEVIKEKERTIYREYTQTNTREYYRDEQKKEVEISNIEHNLGVLPVLVLSFGEKKDLRNPLTPPPFYPIARVVFSLYNLVSQNEDIARSSRFPTLYAQDVDADSLVIGTKAFINLATGTTIAPGYVSPDTNIMTDGRAEATALVQTIYQLAEQSGVTGVVNQQSGVAKEWDFHAHESILQTIADDCAAFEVMIAELFGLFIDRDFTLVAEYPKRFTPGNVEAQVAVIQSILDMQLPSAAAAQLKLKAFNLLTNNDDTQDTEAARIAFTQEAEDARFGASDEDEDEGGEE
jgi:hypothetical protein